MLDYYLDQADRTDTLPSDFQSRFSADGHYWLWIYEQNRSTQQYQRLIRRIRDGHITIPLQTLVLTYGGMPAEAVLRSMYYAGRVERKEGLRFESVSAMEDVTMPYGLISLWAGAGAKYSWKGVCGCYSDIPSLSFRGREIYYASGPDGQKILMKWHSLYPGDNQHSGGYAENRLLGPAGMVDFVNTNSTFLSRYPNPKVVGMFGWGWDDLQDTTDVFVKAAIQKSTPAQRIIVSNEVDFFKDYEESTPAGLTPTYGASYGNDWDGNVATMAEVTASVKRSMEELRCAEAMSTIVSLAQPTFMNGREAMRDTAFNNLGLYFEHNWNNDGPYTSLRPAFNREKAGQIRRYVTKLKEDAAGSLARMIQSPSGGSRFYVFNPLSWSRTDIADILFSVQEPFKVVDVTTGKEVRSQHVSKAGQAFVQILAEKVPSLGYRVYEVQQGSNPFADSIAVTVTNGNRTIENEYYRVTVNAQGAISSLLDKQRVSDWTRRCR